MSEGDKRIICRRCHENISMTLGTCPHCGAEIKGLKGPAAMFIIGLVVLIPTAIEGMWWLAVVGLALMFGGGYFIYDKRSRMKRAEPDQTAPVESPEPDADA